MVIVMLMCICEQAQRLSGQLEEGFSAHRAALLQMTHQREACCWEATQMTRVTLRMSC